jgi:hypothetical protein
LGSAHLPGFVQEEAVMDDYVELWRKNVNSSEKPTKNKREKTHE